MMAERIRISTIILVAVVTSVAFRIGDTVPVVTLDDGMCGMCVPSDNITGLGLDFNFQNIKLCGLLRPHIQPIENDVNIIFYYNFNDQFMAAGTNGSNLWVKVSEETVFFNGSFSTDIWNTFCFLLVLQENKVSAIVNGKRLARLSDQINISIENYSGMCFGSPAVESLSVPAFIAGLSIQTSLESNLFDADIIDTTTCSSLVSNSAILPIESSWFGRNDMVVVDYSEEELCSQSSQNLILKQVGGYHEAEKKCKVLGGSLLSKEDVVEGLVDASDNSLKSCTTDEVFMAWLITKDSKFKDITAECSTLLANGSIGSRPCVSELECNLCRVPTSLRYALYGDIDLFDRYYFLKPSNEGDFFFEGRETSRISKKGDTWVLQSRLHRQSWHFAGTIDPIGRRFWSSDNRNETLTLTSCSVLQFSTDDGFCLQRVQRCDGLADSADGSDERECQERLVTKPADYDSSKGPFQSATNKGTLHYDFQIFYIAYIKTEENVATIDMQHSITWHEPRVRFWDLKEDIWNSFPCKNIWIPRVGLMAGYGIGFEADVELYKRVCIVRKEKNTVEEYDITDPYMGKVVNGGSLNITMRMAFVTNYPCLFQVHQYPFGAYQCNSTFYIKQENPFLKWKGPESSYVAYTGDHNLLDFMLRNITHEIFFGSAFISFTLHLDGQFNYHLLNSFAPSALMFCICYATLFFPLKDFNERIMVSLTAMLVLAALFAQATDSYVRTPYFKLIDIWYAVLICLCFFVVIANVIVNALRLRKDSNYIEVMTHENSNMKSNKTPAYLKAKKFNSVCLVVLFILFIFMMLLFILSATMVI